MRRSLELLQTFRKHHSYYDPKQCAHYYEIGRKCDSLRYRNECLAVAYDFKPRARRFTERKQGAQFVINRSPNEININCHYLIQLSKLSALVYIAGYLGMWFGISVFLCLAKFRDFVESRFFIHVVEKIRSVLQPNRVIFLQQQDEQQTGTSRKKRICFIICTALILVGYITQCIEVLHIYLEGDFTVYVESIVSKVEPLPAFTFFVKNLQTQSVAFIHCVINDEVGNYDNCSKKTASVRLLFNDYTSYSYFLITKQNEKQIMYSTEDNNRILKFTFEKEAFLLEEVYLIIHSSKSLPTFEEMSSKIRIYPLEKIRNYPERCLTFHVSHTKTFKLLKSPYKTKCKEVYTAETSKQSCIRRCIVNHLNIKCALQHTFVNPFLPRYRGLKDCSQASAVVRKCYDICENNDCELLQYEIESSYERNCKQFIIEFSRKPMKTKEVYILQPKFTVLDLLFYISGCLCLWFGIPIMTTFETSMDFLVGLSSHLLSNYYHRLNTLLTGSKRTRDIAIITFACIACIQEVGDIIAIFSRYETTLQLSSTSDTQDNLPVFSFYEKSNEPVLHYSDSSFSKSRFKKCFEICFLLNDVTATPERNFGNFTQSLLAGYIVHSFRSGSNMKVTLNITGSMKPKVAIYFTCSSDIATMYFTFHNIGDSRSITTKSNIILDMISNLLILLTFKRITTRSLPGPCPSYCQCYNDIGFDNREDCVEKCRIKLFVKRCKTFPFNSLWINGLHNRLSFDYNNYRYCKEKEKIDNICSEQCPLSDCVQNFYIVVRNGYLHQRIGNRAVVVVQSPHRSYYVSYERSLRYTLVDVFVYIGNAIGLWLGLSIQSIFSFFFNEIQRIYIQRR